MNRDDDDASMARTMHNTMPVMPDASFRPSRIEFELAVLIGFGGTGFFWPSRNIEFILEGDRRLRVSRRLLYSSSSVLPVCEYTYDIVSSYAWTNHSTLSKCASV